MSCFWYDTFSAYFALSVSHEIPTVPTIGFGLQRNCWRNPCEHYIQFCWRFFVSPVSIDNYLFTQITYKIKLERLASTQKYYTDVIFFLQNNDLQYNHSINNLRDNTLCQNINWMLNVGVIRWSTETWGLFCMTSTRTVRCAQQVHAQLYTVRCMHSKARATWMHSS
jgi:hypothetical protein